jgi:uncharacterized protein YukE
MEPTDLTIEILKDIRAEMRSTRQELSATREELSATREELSERIDGTNKRLDVFAEGQLRLRTEVIEIISAVQQLTSVLREDRQLRRQVDDHERRLGSLEHRTG